MSTLARLESSLNEMDHAQSMSNDTGLRNVRGCQMPHQSYGLQQGTGPIRYTVSALSRLLGPLRRMGHWLTLARGGV